MEYSCLAFEISPRCVWDARHGGVRLRPPPTERSSAAQPPQAPRRWGAAGAGWGAAVCDWGVVCGAASLLALLDIRTLFRHPEKRKNVQMLKEYPYTTGKCYVYPDGSVDLLASSSAIFCKQGDGIKRQKKPHKPNPERHREAEDLDRAKSRARAAVRRIALATDFKYFVTLTFDPSRVDSLDHAAVVKAMSTWCDNHVRRDGLTYILVPELHQSGRVHFHGFFNDALPAVDSGCVKVPGVKKLRKPRTKRDKAELLAAGGKIVYNLPKWTYGFTTALELSPPYPAAVAYVCKYIGKGAEKIGGRWYYSGGEIRKPMEEFVDIDQVQLRGIPGAWEKQIPGAIVCGVNGIEELQDDAWSIFV